MTICPSEQHAWDDCKCSQCDKTRDEQHDWRQNCEKCERCGKTRTGAHMWVGCACSKCGELRDEGHDWTKNCEKCRHCGLVRVGQHVWNGCKCQNCERIREEQHTWEGCKCQICGKARDESHDWTKDCEECARCGKKSSATHDWSEDCEKCKRCGKTRSAAHDWSKDCEKCKRCGKTRSVAHDWAKDCGKCSRCEQTRTGAHDWTEDRICAKCGKKLPVRYEFNGRVYVDDEIAQLVMSHIKAVSGGYTSPEAGTAMALDMVARLPQGMGWNLYPALLFVCKPRVYLGPLYRNVQKNPEQFAKFAVHLNEMSSANYEMELPASYVDEESTLNKEGLEALLACLQDSREAVSNAAKVVFERIKSREFHKSAPDNVEDADGWRKWAEDRTRAVLQLRAEVQANRAQRK